MTGTATRNTANSPDAMPQGAAKARPLLDVRDLKVHFPVTKGFLVQRTVGAVKAVDGVTFTIDPAETLGLVGESGSGKTTIGRAITQLERPTSGQVVFEGRDLLRLTPNEMRDVRRRFGIIFQDPYGALNPRMTAGDIIGEPLLAHRLFESNVEYRARVDQLMEVVGLNRGMASRYPHEFSGGQRQRIGIARALAASPSFVVADEPVSALDVSVQAQIINLLEDLQDRYGVAYLFIAHDLSVVRQMSHRVAVMYLGKIVEMAPRDELYANPLHPYTKALLSAVPIPDPRVERGRERIVLKGDIPSPLNPPQGCVFSSRCPIASDECRVAMPGTRELSTGHFVACYKA